MILSAQDEVCLVGLRHTVVLDTSALALLPVDGDEDEDAARMCPGHKTYRELWKISIQSISILDITKKSS